MPPFGIFASEFLIVRSAFAREPLWRLLLVFGLLVALAALKVRLQGWLRRNDGSPRRCKASYIPMFTHLALVLTPAFLAAAAGLVPESRGCSDEVRTMAWLEVDAATTIERRARATRAA